jgi:hypothetical protein
MLPTTLTRCFCGLPPTLQANARGADFLIISRSYLISIVLSWYGFTRGIGGGVGQHNFHSPWTPRTPFFVRPTLAIQTSLYVSFKHALMVGSLRKIHRVIPSV